MDSRVPNIRICLIIVVCLPTHWFCQPLTQNFRNYPRLQFVMYLSLGYLVDKTLTTTYTSVLFLTDKSSSSVRMGNILRPYMNHLESSTCPKHNNFVQFFGVLEKFTDGFAKIFLWIFEYLTTITVLQITILIIRWFNSLCTMCKKNTNFLRFSIVSKMLDRRFHY